MEPRQLKVVLEKEHRDCPRNSHARLIKEMRLEKRQKCAQRVKEKSHQLNPVGAKVHSQAPLKENDSKCFECLLFKRPTFWK